MRFPRPAALVAASLRGLLLAVVATLLTGLCSWRFIAAADAGDWLAGVSADDTSSAG